MNVDLNDAILRLDADKNLQLRDAQGACVHVHWGDLWITQEGDTKDHVVASGESFAISKPGTTFLAAIRESGISVMERCRNSDAIDGEPRLDKFKMERIWPELSEVERHMEQAARLRARYIANVVSRGWNTLRRFTGAWRALG